MQVLRLDGLPQGALAAAADFHARLLPTIDSSQSGEDLLIVFPPADHTHRGWRDAVIAQLARDLAPRRINAVASESQAAIDSAAAYLAAAPGLTGQVLVLDDAGAGPVVG